MQHFKGSYTRHIECPTYGGNSYFPLLPINVDFMRDNRVAVSRGMRNEPGVCACEENAFCVLSVLASRR